MFHVALVAPEIPPNTGNVIRLCANTGTNLHLIEPLGFDLSAARLRRAGLDYSEMVNVQVHRDWASFRAALGDTRLFALTTRAMRPHSGPRAPRYRPGDTFVFGAESSGLPAAVLGEIDATHRLRLPMVPGNRSLNLSNAVAVMVFEAWRRNGFAGGR